MGHISMKPFVITIVVFLLAAYTAKAGYPVPGCKEIPLKSNEIHDKLVEKLKMNTTAVGLHPASATAIEKSKFYQSFVHKGSAKYFTANIGLGGSPKNYKYTDKCEVSYDHYLSEQKKCTYSVTLKCPKVPESLGLGVFHWISSESEPDMVAVNKAEEEAKISTRLKKSFTLFPNEVEGTEKPAKGGQGSDPAK